MSNYYYTLLLDSNNQYKCFMNISIDYIDEYIRKDLKKYLKLANYQYIYFVKNSNNIIVLFTINLLSNELDMIPDIYEDFQYVLNILKNEKKLIKYYLI